MKALDALFQAANRGDAPGLVVGIACRGKTIYRRGFGLASVQLGVANTPLTRMRIGSVSKQFTCLAAMLLSEEGKLDLDGPATAVLPELPTAHGVPTLRQFMDHTSGVRDCRDLAVVAAGLAPVPKGWMLKIQLAQQGVNYAPGKGQDYCNGGYHLLSHAIERAGGMPFAQFMKSRIFEPLDMLHTECAPDDLLVKPGLAPRHWLQPDGSYRRGIEPFEDTMGEGSIVSTVDDLLTWLRHFNGPKRIGTADTWRRMLQGAKLSDGTTSRYACGLVLENYRGVDIVHHGGDMIGGSAQLLTVPAHELDIAILVNGAPVDPVGLSLQIIDTLIPEHLGPSTDAPLKDSQGFEHLFGERFLSPDGLLIGFGEVSGKLALSLWNSPLAPTLRDHGDTLQFGKGFPGPFVLPLAELAAGTNGKAPARMRIRDGGIDKIFHRLAPPKNAERNARELAGRYRIADLDADALIEAQGEQLTMHFHSERGVIHYALQALSDEVYGVTLRDPLLPIPYALTVDRESGRIRQLRLSGGRTRAVAMEPVSI